MLSVKPNRLSSKLNRLKEFAYCIDFANRSFAAVTFSVPGNTFVTISGDYWLRSLRDITLKDEDGIEYDFTFCNNLGKSALQVTLRIKPDCSSTAIYLSRLTLNSAIMLILPMLLAEGVVLFPELVRRPGGFGYDVCLGKFAKWELVRCQAHQARVVPLRTCL